MANFKSIELFAGAGGLVPVCRSQKAGGKAESISPVSAQPVQPARL